MPSNRDTYNASVKTAAIAKVATLTANETVRQTTIDAAATVAGLSVSRMTLAGYPAYAAAVKAADLAKKDADYAAEQAKQASHAAARDTLRNAGGDSAAF